MCRPEVGKVTSACTKLTRLHTCSLVFQVAIGQTVNIDCLVQANPSSRSVHYSWFSAANNSPDGNLSDWLHRDVALDEQIDESR